MDVWHQNYLPFDSVGLSALAASGPIILFFICLAVLRMKGHVAAALTLALSMLIAVAIFHMPLGMALASAFYGFFYGMWPIAWIIVATVFVYKVAVRSGQFDIIRSSITGLTDDRRLQMLLIGFSFGAFLEGAAGFGAPVAITAALLVGLGFNPLYAAGLCLIADTAPVAFGALGIPVIVAGQVSNLDPFSIGAMAGRQLPLMSVFLPFWLVFVMDGKKGLRETWPAALVAGGSFAVTQYLTSNFLGPELPDVASSIVSLVSLGLFLKMWQPKMAFAPAVSSGGAAAFSAGGAGVAGGFGGAGSPSPYSMSRIVRAWSPFLFLTATITVWGLGGFKALFGPKGLLAATTLSFHMPFIDRLIIRGAPVVATPTPLDVVFKLDLVAATGTGIFLAALIAIVFLRMPAKTALGTFAETIRELRRPILSIGLVLAFAFVENYSGMSVTMALLLAKTGSAYPLFAPLLGWLGVFLTGSDTSSNALFAALQATTAHQIGVSDILLVAANSTGGVAGKMISPQSIAVACAAVGLIGRESDLFRFTLKHSIGLAVIAGIITLSQAYWLTGMLVK
ncbi:L-lactate permease [Caballeronia glathei]|jgi:lactate permease|uniref:L-lactate permease n=1 Tax=Caballeronia glathei TaxID=60547 RepID=A0A069PQI4_9BURK|nr:MULTISPECIES: lactate permease LctP family transporter [Burkholderiaceae]KDR39566.1 L-lactate permease [Caballeronia glathei]TCK36907.1 lactate permease [Paraburkholderia sp. BL8N3]CDY75825.1 L-lactate permease [Caballeronia glathei]